MADATNGKNWLQKGLIQALIIVALTGYIAVDKIAGNGDGKDYFDQAAADRAAIKERVARVEECLLTLRPLPGDMATVKAEIRSIQTTLDKVEKKIDGLK